ncbi:MAG: RNA 2',3'-cyclic phosphodiesterase [Cyanobacteria bacterium REEB65]|nr:RNA 2',3'-cyclic phosphodiesterase [Cyanobacteria bacterium REEB65]
MALPLPPEARSRCLAIRRTWQASSGSPSVRWVSEEQLHLTLRFLGEIADEAIAKVAAALREVALQAQPLDLALTKVTAFPNSRRPTALVLEASAQANLQRLVATLDLRLAASGLGERDKPFRAHVTLGRAKRLDEHPLPTIECAIAWRADRAVLYQSVTKAAGVEYRALYEAILGTES